METNRDDIGKLISGLATAAEHVKQGIQANPLNPVDVRLLALAEERGRVRPSEVAKQLDISPPSVTRHVQALESAGQLTIVADSKDGRSYLIEITEDGRDFLRRFRNDLIDMFRNLLKDWPPEEVATLATLLARLNGAMAEAVAARNKNQRSRRGGKNRWRQIT